jgi:hypothetical protein
VILPSVAQRQIEEDRMRAPGNGGLLGSGESPPPPVNGRSPAETKAPAKALPNRYHGTVVLDATRVGRDAGRIADEVIAHLAGLVGSDVTVTLEIEAAVPAGVPDNVVRIVTENGRVLKFSNQGFERD